MSRIEDLEFSDLGRSGKPWLGAYVAVILLVALAGGCWGCATYFRETRPEPEQQCELRGVSAAGFSVYECPGGAALLVPTTPPERLVPMPNRGPGDYSRKP